MKTLALASSIGLFAVFFANVGFGAMRLSVFLSDVGEMLVLFAACVCFVAAVLLLERERHAAAGQPKTIGRNEK